jgi:hypothetical protein
VKSRERHEQKHEKVEQVRFVFAEQYFRAYLSILNGVGALNRRRNKLFLQLFLQLLEMFDGTKTRANVSEMLAIAIET